MFISRPILIEKLYLERQMFPMPAIEPSAVLYVCTECSQISCPDFYRGKIVTKICLMLGSLYSSSGTSAVSSASALQGLVIGHLHSANQRSRGFTIKDHY
jgi:hypothetical protein